MRGLDVALRVAAMERAVRVVILVVPHAGSLPPLLHRMYACVSPVIDRTMQGGIRMQAQF